MIISHGRGRGHPHAACSLPRVTFWLKNAVFSITIQTLCLDVGYPFLPVGQVKPTHLILWKHRLRLETPHLIDCIQELEVFEAWIIMLGLKTKEEKHYFVNLIVTCCVFHCYYLIGMDKVVSQLRSSKWSIKIHRGSSIEKILFLFYFKIYRLRNTFKKLFRGSAIYIPITSLYFIYFRGFLLTCYSWWSS